MGIELPPPLSHTPGSPENSGLPNRGEQGPGLPRTDANERDNPVGSAEIFTPSYERTPEAQSGAGVGENTGPALSVSQSNVTNTTQDTSSTTAVLDDVPVVAADEDLIEKVWVDAVKGVLARTRNDPYAQSEAISKLQADYLQKRYGKTVGEA